MSSIVIKSRNDSLRDASRRTTGLGVVGASPSSSDPMRAAYDTPDSSVSPGPGSKSQKKDHELSTASGDESDDFYMEGIDDISGRMQPSMSSSSPYMDAQGAKGSEEDPDVAPATLAETYLPALFAQHGPCAIRHLTQYLSVNNPKFGELPASKQRRLVVKALELKRGVLFEKVGWGRWNSVESRASDAVPFTPESMPQSMGQNASLLSASLKQAARVANSVGSQRPPIIGTYPVTPHHEFMFSPSLSVAETSRDDEDDGDIDPLDLDMEGEDSETDEEDWKSLGAEGLRARTNNNSAIGSYRESGSYINNYSGSARSMPYPIRRKSSAGVYQMNTPHLQPGSFSHSPSFSRPSFPKTSSYLKSSPMSNARASSFSKARASQVSPSRITTQPSPAPSMATTAGDQADAVEALVMLANSRRD